MAFILLSPASPAAASGAGAPIRWNTGGAVWSTSQDSFDIFLRTGEVTDRGLAAGLAASGWPVDQLRAALAKSYTVDFLAVSRFLNSEAGERFLRRATTSYGPYDRMTSTAVPALRSAILSDAVDGSISSAGILRALPTAFRLADNGNGHSGAQPICAPGHCRSGTAQCTSLLSWYAFLPACIQARQVTASEGALPSASAP
ncbi:MAG: alpha/beta hydrolase [Cyanobacteria bacterium]|nr:alpha/beta hydrolase [Cyanobacteriota bacterium]